MKTWSMCIIERMCVKCAEESVKYYSFGCALI